MKARYIRQLCTVVLGLLITLNLFSQVPYPHESANSIDAERVANFGVSGVDDQVFEITNATENDGEFLPSLWSHNGRTNYHTIQHLGTTNRSLDSGNAPVVLFIAAVAPGFNLNAPSGVQFPWGNGGTLQSLNNRPAFSWRNGSTTAMLLSANNNLGIGTTTPSSRLHVNGSVRFQSLSVSQELPYSLGVNEQGDVFKVVKDSQQDSQQDSDWLRSDNQPASNINDDIFTNGNVGINVRNPAAALHASGSLIFENLASNSDEIDYYLGLDESGRVYKTPRSEPSGGSEFSNDYDWLKFDNTHSSSISDNIYTLGKVAINVDFLPSSSSSDNVSNYGLFVGGGILTEEVRVSLQNEWADYVFEDNYKLMSIEDLEDYISREGHLPNIPAAEVVEREGLELGEMNKLLLEKLEELSLYIIELNKTIKSQESKIDFLMKNVK
ncbi:MULTISPECIES: hypothetical protein [unclassified Leeuwenhoekiella]|uniref:hypothetical protein n=1 Tax=unclassified Leeuwenhoekiella TaxID=2615029 RepID=UPI000C6913C3|nr:MULTISPECIES: hypothetical protein [unclassified Leeuwenhoekiella]MAW96209.1 hypothetical protein [Leeuwenhoekiella sp.]MBA80203.1 hypothetical protein [Leeuwenhoekiella sp.]|tara:strand:- start:6142 stop:7458 length:1317 start_codon:yes stop_codon:yes gene_type:complete